MTLSAFAQPLGLALLFLWSFLVLAAVQLTVRLIMAFSVVATLRAAAVVTVLAYPVAFIYDLCTGPAPPFDTRLTWAPVPMLLMAVIGWATARWVLRFRRVRGQVVAGIMVGILAPQLFTLPPH